MKNLNNQIDDLICNIVKRWLDKTITDAQLESQLGVLGVTPEEAKALFKYRGLIKTAMHVALYIGGVLAAGGLVWLIISIYC